MRQSVVHVCGRDGSPNPGTRAKMYFIVAMNGAGPSNSNRESTPAQCSRHLTLKEHRHLSLKVTERRSTGALPFSEWNFHLGKAARYCRVHRFTNCYEMLLYKPPWRLAQNHERDFSVGKVLLVADVFVSRHQKVEASFLGKLEQRSV